LRAGGRRAPVGIELTDDDIGMNSVVQQNLELRRRLDEEHSGYRRKLQTYQDEQHRQTQLVQKLQAKVHRQSDHFSQECFVTLGPI